MITIDTNVVVRYLIKDDETQARLAIDLFKNNRCFILKTVILETVMLSTLIRQLAY